MSRRLLLVLALVAFTDSIVGAQDSSRVGAVYTMSNAAGGNAMLTFDRLADGRLLAAGSTPTGGQGSGGGLGNQGALTLTPDGRWLLAVNAGSDTISVFAVGPRSLELTDVEPSGGDQPVSVTEYRGLVYVLNAGSDTIVGFELERTGMLRPLPGSTRSLSAAGTAPAQVGFSPNGDVLVVTEKATNKIVTFQVNRNGLAGPAQVHNSNGPTPFGFAFGHRNQLFVSEAFGGAADASATSSYEVNAAGALATIIASIGTHQTANCWVVVTPNGRFAYVTNTGQWIDLRLPHRAGRRDCAARCRWPHGHHRRWAHRPGAERQRTVFVQSERRNEYDWSVPRRIGWLADRPAVHKRSAGKRQRSGSALTDMRFRVAKF